MVMGEGKNPTIDHLQALGVDAKISNAKVTQIIDQTKSAISEWDSLAKTYGVSATNIRLIENHIKKHKA